MLCRAINIRGERRASIIIFSVNRCPCVRSTVSARGLQQWRTVCLLACPVFVLIAVQAFLPESLDTQFAFHYHDPRLFTVWSAMAVHYSWTHLVSNLVAYLAVAATGYLLATTVARERVFWLAAVGIGVAVPPIAVSVDRWLLISHWNVVAPTATAAGFSVIVAGLTGLLTVLISVAARIEYTRRGSTLLGGVVLFSSSLNVGVQNHLLPRWIAAVTILIALIAGGWWIVRYSRRHLVFPRPGPSDLRIATGCILTIGLLGSLLTYRVTAGELSNVFAHGTAFVTGLTWSLLALWIDANVLSP